jgi:AcrR family transcriptional regulator
MSDTPNPRVPVEALREAGRRAPPPTSTHRVAAEVGMSQGGIRKFLAGSEPHPGTLRKLAEWYVRHAAVSREIDAETVEAALLVLLDSYPEKERGKVRESVLRVLREAHRKAGTDPPGWLVE